MPLVSMFVTTSEATWPEDVGDVSRVGCNVVPNIPVDFAAAAERAR